MPVIKQATSRAIITFWERLSVNFWSVQTLTVATFPKYWARRVPNANVLTRISNFLIPEKPNETCQLSLFELLLQNMYFDFWEEVAYSTLQAKTYHKWFFTDRMHLSSVLDMKTKSIQNSHNYGTKQKIWSADLSIGFHQQRSTASIITSRRVIWNKQVQYCL